MDFPKVEPTIVKEGDFLIVRYMPMYQNKGIVATGITEVYDGGFGYQNLPMDVQGSIDEESLEEMREMGMRIDEPLIGLPQGFRPPLAEDLVHRVGGVYIPKSQRDVLAQLSQDKIYQQSVKSLENPDKIRSLDELQQVLD